MADVATHLVDEASPKVPVRQWVCSLPGRLRYAMDYDREPCADVLDDDEPPTGHRPRLRAQSGGMRFVKHKTRARGRLVLAVLLLGACGPPRLDVAETGGSTTTGEPTTGEPMATTTDSETSEPTFIPKLDSHVPDACDSFLQDCAEGEKCVPYFPSSGQRNYGEDFKCVPVGGDRTLGESCNSTGWMEATDDCDADSVCWNSYDPDAGVGTCHAFCTGHVNDAECPFGSYCASYIFVCIPRCDPVAQDCGPGLDCHLDSPYTFTCRPATQNIPTGEPCGDIADCAAGNACINALALPDCVGAACCSMYCDLDLGDAQCDAQPGTVCAPFFEEGMAPPEYVHVGVCIVPDF